MIKKAAIILSHLESKTLPLGRMVPPEFWLLHGQPLIARLVDEAVSVGVEEVILVGPAEKKEICDYFDQEGFQHNADSAAKHDYERIKFSFIQGDSVLDLFSTRAKSGIRGEAVVVIEANYLLSGGEGACVQLLNLFKTTEKTVLGLSSSPQDFSGINVIAEKIAERIYKVKEIESSEGQESSLKIIGRSIIGKDFEEMLAEFKKERRGEDIDFEKTLVAMVNSGKVIYGYEMKGHQFDLNTEKGWLEANKYLAFNND